ncbi:uncharacterized protein PG998_004768 [Apiospora kogelbergensis]|uniref:uncharacterized protein n=1 Tax=Apiospora kogelbergensis TaxID=1337665 RepID=UPI00312D615C
MEPKMGQIASHPKADEHRRHWRRRGRANPETGVWCGECSGGSRQVFLDDDLPKPDDDVDVHEVISRYCGDAQARRSTIRRPTATMTASKPTRTLAKLHRRPRGNHWTSTRIRADWRSS